MKGEVPDQCKVSDKRKPMSKDSTCHNVRSSTYDPSELKFCKTDKENLT